MTARQASDVVADFAAAADRLQAMAADWAVGQFRHHDLENAGAILRGLVAMLVELRQGEDGTAYNEPLGGGSHGG